MNIDYLSIDVIKFILLNFQCNSNIGHNKHQIFYIVKNETTRFTLHMHHESWYIDVCKIIINNVVNNGYFTYFLFTSSINSPLTTNIAFAHFLLDNAFTITFSFPFTYCMSKKKCCKNSTHLHCLQPKVDWMVKYQKPP